MTALLGEYLMNPVAGNLVAILALALVGAILGLDVVSFPQAMLSRPIVAATLTGVLVGHGERGILIGVALEFFALETMPFGASRYPEWGSASVVGAVVFSAQSSLTPGAMTFAVFAALATAQVGYHSMVLLRRFNARAARVYQPAIAEGSWQAVTMLQVSGLAADFVRGGLLTALGLLVFVPLRAPVLGSFEASGTLSRAVVVSLASAVGLAAVWKITATAHGARWWLLGGLAVGFALAGGLG
jgi:PTS system mannose-specific IIC component